MNYDYYAGKVDDTTWMVKRYPRETGDVKARTTGAYDESLLREMPLDATEQSAIYAAIARGSWA